MPRSVAEFTPLFGCSASLTIGALWVVRGLQGGDYDDKTYEYDNVFQMDDFCIILLKRRFLRYLVQKQGELTVSVLFGRAVHCTVHD